MNSSKYCFTRDQVGDAIFSALEDQAIDGQLDYDEFPPEEYRYFSKLARLGYLNRHKGWTKKTCELKQEEYCKEYIKAVEERSGRLRHMKRLQSYMVRSTELSRKLYLSRNKEEAFGIALDLIEQLLEQPGLKQRIVRNLIRKDKKSK